MGGGGKVLSPRDGKGERLRPLLRFLAKLCTDRASQLVENANRRAHGGSLAEPDAPLAPETYREASEALMMVPEPLALSAWLAGKKRGCKRAAPSDAPAKPARDAAASAALLARDMDSRWQSAGGDGGD